MGRIAEGRSRTSLSDVPGEEGRPSSPADVIIPNCSTESLTCRNRLPPSHSSGRP